MPEKQQKEVQDNYERTKKTCNILKIRRQKKLVYNLFSDTIPFSTSEAGTKRTATISYLPNSYKALLQQATNIQNPTKKETALNYLKSVKEWLDQQQQKLNLIGNHVKLKHANDQTLDTTKAPEKVGFSGGFFFQVDVAFIDFTSCFGYSTQ
ncbi:hypothetical protein NNO77_15530 [Enterococcus faecium]|nr:hypothetical protein [Enterococcus faecium]